MSGDTEVLRSFLVSLGFKVDEAGMRKFTTALGTGPTGIAGVALSTGKAIAGVAAAAQAMVVVFSDQMEKLYYASRRTGASVGNIMALEAGSKRIGLAAGVAREALESMSSAVRMYPGLRGLMDMITGKNTAGMDQSKAMLEVVKKLSGMPHYLGARYAQMFGLDEKTFFMLKEGMPELLKAEQAHADLLKKAGVNADEAAAASKEYMNTLRDLGDKVSVLGLKMSIELLPVFKAITAETNKVLDKTLENGVLGKWGGLRQLGRSLNEWLIPGYKDYAAKQDAKQAARKGRDTGNLSITPGGDVPAPASVAQPTVQPATPSSGSAKAAATSPNALLSSLEALYKLPSGWLDRVWNRESNRGNPKYMVSSAGAKGHFGFMDPTAKEYGVSDPNDFTQSATGAAKYFSWLFKRYKGDARMAAAAYNWGPGKLDTFGIGAAPSQTRKYMDVVAGPEAKVTVNQQNTFHVDGSKDPSSTADAIGRMQARTATDIFRNTVARVN